MEAFTSPCDDPDIDFGFQIAGGILAAISDSDDESYDEQDFLSRFHRRIPNEEEEVVMKPSVVLRMMGAKESGLDVVVPKTPRDETRDNTDSLEEDEQEEEAIVIQTMYESMTSTELREICATIGVDYRGLKKRLLIAVLMEHVKAGWAIGYLTTLQAKELRRECINLGKNSTGCLAKLAERIVAALKERKTRKHRRKTPRLSRRGGRNKGRSCPCPKSFVEE